MTKQILMMMTLLTAFTATGAQAANTVQILTCSLEKPMMDYGIGVDIERVMNDSPRIGRDNTTLVATITEQTIAGPHTISTTAVRKSQSGAMGAPQYYLGPDFNLEVKVDTAPVKGRIRAHLTSEANGRRISEELLCSFVR